MPFFPFQSFRIELSLSARDAEDRLVAAVQPETFLGRWSEQPFRGRVGQGRFVIHRMPSHRRRCEPVLRGRIVEEGARCRLEGTMTLHPLMWLFIVIFLMVLKIG